MKVHQLISGSSGRPVANQFIITDKDFTIFQSYKTIIVKITYENGKRQVTLDRDCWDYSITTGRYRNQFLDEKKAETERKIKSGEYKLADLNK